jgi:hypothetical protein
MPGVTADDPRIDSSSRPDASQHGESRTDFSLSHLWRCAKLKPTALKHVLLVLLDFGRATASVDSKGKIMRVLEETGHSCMIWRG